MLLLDTKRKWVIAMKVVIILFVFSVIVLVLPKSENFRYEYQVGNEWRYETLKAPFDFPIYKSSEEITTEKTKITKNQIPIFDFNPNIKNEQLRRFSGAVSKFTDSETQKSVKAVENKLVEIYDTGILQLPENFSSNDVATIKIVHNNVGNDVPLGNVYSLKTAYTTITYFIEEHAIPEKAKTGFRNIDMSNYLTTNLLFDESKTKLELEEHLENISLTRGMIHAGDVVVNKNEIVTQEKYIVLNSLKREYRQNITGISSMLRIIVGLSILTLAGMFVFAPYSYFFRKRNQYKSRDFIFLFGSFLVTVLMGSVAYYYKLNIYVIPILFMVIISNILIDKRTAFYLLLGSSMLVSFFAPNSYMYLFMQITAGIVGIFSLTQLQRRGQLFIAIFFIFLTYSLVFSAFTFINEGDLKWVHVYDILALLINCLLLSISYIAIYVFERLFGFISEITLIELSNPNHPALRDLTKKAPGTFQHSLLVANLAEEAIHRIGGNPLLVRTGALYHDIGKTQEPLLFIENQAGGLNPHSKMEFDESAKHIINHVIYGIQLAKKYNIPEPIIDFIRTHHGKSKVKYFYNSFKNKYPNKEINEAAFTYPGPDPTTKETAVLMMADAIEAASRALPEKTEENINKLVSEIINTQIEDGRFTYADITFRNISVVKESFTETLSTIYHSRIAYPKLNQDTNTTKK
ncbi:MAG: HDIG domain-containing protein [Culturomica sp.]|jgi:putative nucleotidyltransferase with HDIG domain|nr:HDIG domain-containing protein [Culturomica sp.]